MDLDKIDKFIIQKLLDDGRASFSAIAREVKLTDVAIKKRFERLKRKGIINAISADLNFSVLGYEKPLFVQARTEISKSKDIQKKLDQLDFVMERYNVLGEYNLLLKLIIPDLNMVEKYVEQIGIIDGIMDVKTHLVVNEAKKSSLLPTHPFQKRFNSQPVE